MEALSAFRFLLGENRSGRGALPPPEGVSLAAGPHMSSEGLVVFGASGAPERCRPELLGTRAGRLAYTLPLGPCGLHDTSRPRDIPKCSPR
eukprot:5809954-Alexandrium_andersonii.AAC.1